MPQKTTSAALIQLRPLEKTNTGAIVEEHIRYWKKVKDDKEAAKLAREARENEFKRKIAKDNFDTYKGLSDIEADGYFKEQIINDFDQNAERLADLGKLATSGDRTAMIQFEQEKRKYRNYIKASVVVAGKTKELAAQKAAGTYNEHLDKDLLDFTEQIARSNYALDPKTGKFRIYDKKNPRVLMEIDPLKLTNEYLSANFNKPVNFTTTGTTLAKGLLDTVDGERIITGDTKTRGVQLASNQFTQDPILAKSWYRSQQDSGAITNKKLFEELDDVEFSNLATSFYEQAIEPNISEITKDTALEDEAKRLEILRKRQLLRKGEREAQEAQKGVATINVTTTEEGSAISAEITATGQPVSTEILGDTMFTIKGGFSIDEVEGDKETRTTYTNFARGKDGIVAIGKKVVKVPVLDEDGEPIRDSNGVLKFKEETITFVEKNKTKLGDIATRLTNKEGRLFENLTELDIELKSLEQPTEKTSKPKRAIEEIGKLEKDNLGIIRTTSVQLPNFPKGETSTVLMTSHGNHKNENGKYTAFPTLFPKDPKNQTSDPKDWIIAKNDDEAFEIATSRGEVNEYDTKEEADAVAEGSWKITEPKKTIKESQVKSAADNAGYTVKEYRRLLKENDVKIIK